jgi:hypothetical protein
MFPAFFLRHQHQLRHHVHPRVQRKEHRNSVLEIHYVSQDVLDFHENAPSSLADDFGRLQVCAENVAAHRRGVISLDHRLREASSIRESVQDLLTDLNTVLVESKSAPSIGVTHIVTRSLAA